MAGSKNLGALYGQIGADTSQWDRAVRGVHADLRRIEAAGQRVTRRISSSFKNAGRGMRSIGRSMNQYVTLPLVAAGGAALKFSSDFNDSLTQAQAQADLTAREISVIGDTATDMAIQTGEATAEIIEAYKFTLSAGLDLAESQKLVRQAAMASASGFGEQRELVRLATTALQAYGDRLDSSRQFMDLLVGSAQNMELEVRKLGPALQRNVGIAKELGVGLDQLLAGIGSVSEVMGDANRGGRLFQGMLARLLKPTKEGEEAISAVFGSVENLHEAIREDGLIESMVRLREGFKETNKWGLENVFSSRRLEAALNLTNRRAERAYEILGDMGNTMGVNNETFQESVNFSRRLAQSWQALQAALRPVGDVLMNALNPLLEQATGFLSSMAEKLENMNPKVIQAGAVITGLVGALGPLLSLAGFALMGIGKLVSGFGSLLSMTTSVVGFFAGLSWPVVLGVAGIAGAAAAIIANWGDIVDYFQNEGSKFLDPVKRIIDTFTTRAIQLLKGFAKAFQKGWDIFGSNLVSIAKGAFTTLINLIGAGLEGLSVVLNIWSGKWLTNWKEFLSDTESSFENTFGEDGFLTNIATSWWQRFLQNDPTVQLGNWISSLFGQEGVLQQASKNAKQQSQETADSIEGIYKGLAKGLQNIDFSGGLSGLLGMSGLMDMMPGGQGKGAGRSGLKSAKVPASPNLAKDINEQARIYNKTVDEMIAKGAEFSSITQAALQGSTASWQNFIQKSKAAGFDFVNFMSNQVSGAITGFAEMVGKSMVGAGNSFATGLEKVLLVVIDFAKRLGELLIGIGTAMEFVPGMQGPGGAYIAGGAALVALASASKAVISRRIDKREQRQKQNTTSVGDALVKSDGSIVEFAPNDDILASPQLGALASPTTTTASPNGGPIELEAVLRGEDIYLSSMRAKGNYER